MGNLEKPGVDDGGPHRFIHWLEGCRKWFAFASVFAAAVGVILNLSGITLGVQHGSDAAATSPLSALSILCLAASVLNSDRRTGRFPINEITSFLAIAICIVPHATRLLGSADFDMGVFRGKVGLDTALIVTFLALSVLMRFRSAFLGLMFGMFGTAFVLNALIGQTYGLPYFKGQMAPTTLISLVLAIWSVASLYLHRPLVRVMFLSGAIGTRTRVMMAVGFGAPWISGFLLHHWYGVPERAHHVEATLISAIIWTMMAVALASGYINEKSDQKRRLAEHKLLLQAIHDPLTGLLNRTGLTQTLTAQWQRFERTGVPAAIVLIDLDHFKSVNDTYGHSTGDDVLRSVRHVLLPHLREEDVIGRWGGEEFLCVLDDTDLQSLQQIAERVRIAIEGIADLPALSQGKGRIPISGSIGISTFVKGDRGYEAAIKRADDSLYAAKRNGRNRVVFDPVLRRTFMKPRQPESALTA